MSILEALNKRRAIRNYETKEVEEETIHQLLEAATWAPNDRMREPWSFYIIRGEAKLRYEALAEEYLRERFPTKPNLVASSLDVVKSTPLMIVVASDIIPADPAATEDNMFAVCCAVHSMWLAAEELGLGFVWRTRGVGLVRDDRLQQFIGSPQNKKIVGTIFTGYPKADTPAGKVKQRTPFEEKTFWL